MIIGYVDIVIYAVILTLLAVPLGHYIAGVYTGKTNYLSWVERLIYRAIGVAENEGMSWKEYNLSLIWFSFIGAVGLLLLLVFQRYLPLNPEHVSALSWDLSLNTVISFLTNTDWQNYSGEVAMSYLSQMLGLAVQNFLSAACGLTVLMALIRGFTGVETKSIGNFWQDLVRSILYILVPLSLIFAICLVKFGVPQNLNQYSSAKLLEPTVMTQVVDGKNVAKTITMQTIPMGPIASQESIKMIGTNGGGFFNANSAHPYENPNASSNFLEMVAILLIPASLCFAFGSMVSDKRQGYAIYIVMLLVFIISVVCIMLAEAHGNPSLRQFNLDQLMNTFQSGGNMEGKETRFGVFGSSLFTAATTSASCGAVNTMHDSMMPLGGLIPMFLIQISEVIFGGVGSGLYTMLAFVILTVFIAGLMIGRTPEYLGKKIESFEMKMIAIIVLVTPLFVLVETAISLVIPQGVAGIANPGAHGLSEVLYAFSSAANNNGSAFAGLNGNTIYYNIMLAIAMLFGRFGVIIPILAIAGSLASKKRIPVTSGTMPTCGVFFMTILVGVILIVGALTYIPALALGPIVEHLMLF